MRTVHVLPHAILLILLHPLPCCSGNNCAAWADTAKHAKSSIAKDSFTTYRMVILPLFSSYPRQYDIYFINGSHYVFKHFFTVILNKTHILV